MYATSYTSNDGNATMSRVTPQSTVVASERQVSSDLGGEAVLLHLESGVYYGLNSVGAAIWALVHEPRSVIDIQKSILEEFAVDAERSEKDVMTLLRQFEAEGLIDVLDGGPVAPDDGRAFDAKDR